MSEETFRKTIQQEQKRHLTVLSELQQELAKLSPDVLILRKMVEDALNQAEGAGNVYLLKDDFTPLH